jgi:hypothetical protein
MHTCDGCAYNRPDGSCSRDYDPLEREREEREMEKIREEWRARFRKVRAFFRKLMFWRGECEK